MAIKLNIVPAPTFTAPVEIRGAGEAPPVTLAVTWKHKGRKALKEWCASPKGGTRTDVDLIDEVIAGWDAEAAGAPYSREALEQLFDDFPSASLDFAAAYRTALLEGRRGN